VPYVIENVAGARRKLINPVRLCGSSFGLDVRRHRYFEANWPLMGLPCVHGWQTPRFPAATNRRVNSRSTVEVGVWRIPLGVQQRAMGIDWMTLRELSEAIPPAYGEHVGKQLMGVVMRYDADWVPPWRMTEQAMCRAGSDCHLLPPALVMACTTIDGYCVGCAKKRGIRASDDDEPGFADQLSLPGSWGA
jgi:hypothetical protein